MNQELQISNQHNLVQYELTVKDVVGQVGKIQEMMKALMKNNEHYGRIPGTPKPTLLKPGAEKLNVMFRLSPEYEIIADIHDSDLIRYNVRCILTHIPTGNRVATGLGSCNSREKRYKAQVEKGGAADLDNTLLKMACKRALVAATLNATAASDIFSQDLEDLPPEFIQRQESKPAPKPAPAPVHHDGDTGFDPTEQQMDEMPFDAEPAPAPAPVGNVISDPQRKRLYAIARGAGFTDKQFQEEMESMGYKSSKDVTKSDYENVCAHFQK